MKQYATHLGIAAGALVWLILNSVSVLEIAQKLYTMQLSETVDAVQWGIFCIIPITFASILIGFVVYAAIQDFTGKK